MENHQERNNRIRQMREAGDSIEEIASTLGISQSAVRQIAYKFETEAVLSARSSRFLAGIRELDDFEKKWKVGYLVQAIRPKVMTQNAIIHNFDWAKTYEISLRELMELTISIRDHPKAGWLLTPLLDFRCVGLEGFWSIVGSLTQSDLGDRCNQEWRSRLAKLKAASRLHGGGRYSWSKACEHPDWLMKLALTP